MKLQCNLCPRQCNAIRDEQKNIGGFCGMPYLPKVARADLHFWEEPCISGTNGSGTIFFSGCTLRCVYCQNFEISHKNSGEIISVERLAEIMRELEQKGAHNINFVNPTHYFHIIKQALDIYRPHIPLVCNSSGYELAQNINEDIFDIYLFDLKYISSDKALKYSGVADYFEVASKAITAAYKLKGAPKLDKNGIMQSGVIVRHLVLPLSTNEAIGVIDWFCDNTPEAILSVMAQYLPCGNAAKYKEINRKITKREYEKVLNYLYTKDIKNIYIQERQSADKKFIPDFNGGKLC
ncbi:MAG: radical SAM protein [Clostridia bacterium]|nr:radical SAM protein [Clostridia bacterium]